MTTGWMPAYEFFWDSNRREEPYDIDEPNKWGDPLLWRINSGKRTTIMMFQERDRMNRRAQLLLDKRPLRNESFRRFVKLYTLVDGVKESANLRYYSKNCKMESWIKQSDHGDRKTKMLILEPRERIYLRWARPTLFTPRGLHKTDIRIPLERKILTNLALQNWW